MYTRACAACGGGLMKRAFSVPSPRLCAFAPLRPVGPHVCTPARPPALLHPSRPQRNATQRDATQRNAGMLEPFVKIAQQLKNKGKKLSSSGVNLFFGGWYQHYLTAGSNEFATLLCCCLS